MASRSIKTEAVVLRGIRYGEADRILHLYSPSLGRVGAIAKGVRKPRSRFGGRLEPFFRVELMLHRGRSDLATISSVSTLAGHGTLRSSAAGLSAASGACDAVSRLFETEDPSPAAYNLLCRYLELLDRSTPEAVASRSVAFRLKLALAAGFAPELGSCARCGDSDHLAGFSGEAGGVVCSSCERDSFRLDPEAHSFMVAALGSSLAGAPGAPGPALRQADRAVREVLEHHAHVRLGPLPAGG